ncbi:hypothetical protein CDD81_6476 [Ophiocordyceps australis]|uniref:Uncharacterized protein n=1 Tax=Ophiocordyceps australis TaxID=1399860 RepID=A0A2C5XBX8_9HYPO|nr:hypothetical protein CDD81_6476 [Ophiocordyceps australis]
MECASRALAQVQTSVKPESTAPCTARPGHAPLGCLEKRLARCRLGSLWGWWGDKWGSKSADETLSDHVQLQLAACSAPQPAPPCFQSTVASKHWCYQSQAVAPAGKQPAISALWRPGTVCPPTVCLAAHCSLPYLASCVHKHGGAMAAANMEQKTGDETTRAQWTPIFLGQCEAAWVSRAASAPLPWHPRVDGLLHIPPLPLFLGGRAKPYLEPCCCLLACPSLPRLPPTTVSHAPSPILSHKPSPPSVSLAPPKLPWPLPNWPPSKASPSPSPEAVLSCGNLVRPQHSAL